MFMCTNLQGRHFFLSTPVPVYFLGCDIIHLPKLFDALLLLEFCLQYTLTFYERKAQEVELNCLEIHQVFEVAYFALAVNWLVCDSNFSVIFQYLKALKKMYI